MAIRLAPRWLFVVLLAASVVMAILANQWYVPSGVWKPLAAYSHGLLHPGLIWGVVFFVAVIWGILLGVGRRTPTEIGLEWRKLPTAVLYTCVLWVAAQIVLGACMMGFGDGLTIAIGWNDARTLTKAGALLAQLFGNAFCEEIVFRGFFLMQFVLVLSARWPNRPGTAVVISFCLASVLFALSHIPYHLRPDNYTSASELVMHQVQAFVMGVVFGWVYWQTQNLFFAVGFHSLSNEPTSLLAWHDVGQRAVVVLVALGLAAAWPRLPATERTLATHRRTRR